MEALEVIVLIAGGIIFILSFILPRSKEEVSNGTKELARKEIKALVAQEMDDVRSHVDDVVDEAVGYAVEKTERSLERLTNEKIMAVNEYSDTVLQEIHKNHEEVMFLYDMLNSKHTNLKNTVSEVNKTVKEVEETKREAEAVVNSFQRLNPDSNISIGRQEADMLQESLAEMVEEKQTAGSSSQYQPIASELESGIEEADGMDDVLIQEEKELTGTGNERILELYRQGRSVVEIAKELGRGVGEVKLVIDLYKNM